MRELRKETETYKYIISHLKEIIIRNERTPKGDGNFIDDTSDDSLAVIRNERTPKGDGNETNINNDEIVDE